MRRVARHVKAPRNIISLTDFRTPRAAAAGDEGQGPAPLRPGFQLSKKRSILPSLMLRWLTAAGALIVLGTASPALCQPPPPWAGRIKMVSGDAVVVRRNAPVAARTGELVFAEDVLRTGAGGQIAVTMKDDTRISIGPNSDVRLATFEFAPAEGRLALTLRIARGVLAYVSGRIARLSPDSVRLETPSALVGVRGTRLAIRVESP